MNQTDFLSLLFNIRGWWLNSMTVMLLSTPVSLNKLFSQECFLVNKNLESFHSLAQTVVSWCNKFTSYWWGAQPLNRLRLHIYKDKSYRLWCVNKNIFLINLLKSYGSRKIKSPSPYVRPQKNISEVIMLIVS